MDFMELKLLSMVKKLTDVDLSDYYTKEEVDTQIVENSCTPTDVMNEMTKSSKQLFDYKTAISYPWYINSGGKKITSSSGVRSVVIPVNVTNQKYITIHRELKAPRFLIGTCTEESPSAGSSLVNVADRSNSTGDYAYNVTLSVDSSIKSVVVCFWHTDSQYTEEEILRSLMVQYGSSYTGYEEYVPFSLDIDAIQSVTDKIDAIDLLISKQGLCDRVLSRNSMAKDYQYQYMRNIADMANAHAKADALSFLWVTDTHTTENNTDVASVVAQMTKYFPCEYVAHTGDIIDGVSDPAKELSILTELNRNFLDSNCPVFYVKGNHDDNCLYARQNGKLGEHYILDKELYARAFAFNKNTKNPAGNDKLYYYYDDESTKIRSIFVNVYDCSEECDENGARLYDARTQAFSQEQLDWLKNDALNFSEKENTDEWAIIVFSHMYMHGDAYKIFGDFQNGKNTFAEQGKREVIAWFVGDDHLDQLTYYNWTYDDFKTCRIGCLNASSARDNTEDAATDNTILYPPSKPANTENETAFDLVTIDRKSGLIYLTRYGARSYVYNQDTSAYDTIAARTRIVDYRTAQYIKLVD